MGQREVRLVRALSARWRCRRASDLFFSLFQLSPGHSASICWHKFTIYLQSLKLICLTGQPRRCIAMAPHCRRPWWISESARRPSNSQFAT